MNQILSYNERQEKAREVGNKTKQETLELLEKHGRCLVTRPTGIGKTFLLNALAREYKKKYPDKLTVYLYPTDIIVNEIKSNEAYSDIADELEFMSFQKISLAFGGMDTERVSNMTPDERAKLQAQKDSSIKEILDTFSKASIVLIDEVHRVASEKLMDFFMTYDYIFTNNNIHIVGVTATIDRTEEEETNWIKNELLHGVEVYKYSLSDALNDGILLPLQIFRPIFNFAKEVETLADQYKKVSANKSYYHSGELDQLIAKASKEWGSNGHDIYNAVSKVGYRLDSDNPDDSFLRFIVFFQSTKHMVEEGENIENYFRLATNSVASELLGTNVETDLLVEYVISTTADINNDMIVKDLCDKESFRIYRDKTSDVCQRVKVVENKKVKEYIPPKAHRVHLIFNVGTIIMGYHVPHISGIMMLRGTGTSIMFYQQLGRCFSVKNRRPSIVFDVVSNISKLENNFGKDRQRRELVIKNTNNNGVSESKEQTELDDIMDAYQVGIDNLASDKFLNLISALQTENTSFLYTERIKWLYQDRNLPIVFIANDLGMTCDEVVNVLLGCGINIENEKYEADYIIDSLEKVANDSNIDLLGKLYSKTASDKFLEYRKRSKHTLFSFLAKKLSSLGSR